MYPDRLKWSGEYVKEDMDMCELPLDTCKCKGTDATGKPEDVEEEGGDESDPN